MFMQAPTLFSRRAVCAVLTSLVLPSAMAWTDKPVKIIVPAPAGGVMDLVARIVGDQIAKDIGHPVVVDNRPGAGGVIGMQALVAAPADGSTIMFTASNLLTEIPHILKPSMDIVPKVRPVAVAARDSLVMVGAPNLEAKDLKAVIAYVKANPGKVSFASYSTGTASHYAGMILNQKAGLDMQHVGFPGIPPALTQVMGGHIPLMFSAIGPTKQFIAAGKVQAYGVATKTRSSQLPNVPTLAEQGFPDLEFSNWVGVIASVSMPDDIVNKINDAVNKAANHPEVKAKLVGTGFEVSLRDLEAPQLAQSVKAEFERNAAIVKMFNIKAE
jgi:tripartite-type tricarboxylate transporter receptor subunit TctC